MTCNMSCDQSYPFPQVFLVDDGGGRQYPAQPPNLVPCWSFPPAQEKLKSREKSRGYMGVSPGVALIVLMLFLLVFAALGFEAYQIYKLQTELKKIREMKPEFIAAEKQISLYKPELTREEKDNRPAARVMGRIEKVNFPTTLRWEPQASQAFTTGGVSYRPENGALQINESGLYHVYSRVELIFKDCSPATFTHTVFVRSGSSVLTLMEAHRVGFCHQKKGFSWTTESYLASAVQLQKSDRVFVNVTNPEYLTHAHHANFFGLYKI